MDQRGGRVDNPGDVSWLAYEPPTWAGVMLTGDAAPEGVPNAPLARNFVVIRSGDQDLDR
jgi:hypothetical protein